jgi:hypothetical protein
VFDAAAKVEVGSLLECKNGDPCKLPTCSMFDSAALRILMLRLNSQWSEIDYGGAARWLLAMGMGREESGE